MDVEIALFAGNAKFMWDGRIYDRPEEAADRRKEYEGNGFEVKTLEREGKHLVYTRRVVKEVVVASS